MFYGGESAYNFQYREFAPDKYGGDAEWLGRNKGFTIWEARDVVYAIARHFSALPANGAVVFLLGAQCDVRYNDTFGNAVLFINVGHRERFTPFSVAAFKAAREVHAPKLVWCCCWNEWQNVRRRATPPSNPDQASCCKHAVNRTCGRPALHRISPL